MRTEVGGSIKTNSKQETEVAHPIDEEGLDDWRKMAVGRVYQKPISK